MGFFSDLFGDEKDRDRAMARAFAQYRTEMTQYLSQFEDRFSDIISMVESDRDVDIAAFTEGFQTAIDNYQEGVIDQLAAGFGEARGLMEQGFDQTLEDIQRQTEAASLRSLAQGALSGVSGTGFGQAQTEAIRAEGARELRRADESFRREMSNLALSEAGALAEAEGNMTNLMVQRTTGESDLRRAYTASISGLQSTLAQTMLAGGQSIADAGFQTGMGRAQNIGSGFNLGQALVGAGLAVATGGIGGALGLSDAAVRGLTTGVASGAMNQ
tara:strand:+ start:152 stop:967 length:816 start_codon:yes stop_codon:yes gene_type:complete